MSGEYVIVAGGKVVEHCCGSLQEGLDCRPVPDKFLFIPNLPVASYDANWNLLPLAQRIAAGLVTVASTEKIVGDRIEPKTVPELVRDGIKKRPPGSTLDKDADGNAILRPSTITEQVAVGDMTQATADTINAINVRADRNALLADCDWVDTVSAQTRMPAETLQQWLRYMQALRDIPGQKGFPSGAITWPTPPTGVTP